MGKKFTLSFIDKKAVRLYNHQHSEKAISCLMKAGMSFQNANQWFSEPAADLTGTPRSESFRKRGGVRVPADDSKGDDLPDLADRKGLSCGGSFPHTQTPFLFWMKEKAFVR
jgi:guanyl-specific ribonuclease Sa